MEKELKEIVYQLQLLNKNFEKLVKGAKKTKEKAKQILKEEENEGRDK